MLIDKLEEGYVGVSGWLVIFFLPKHFMHTQLQIQFQNP